MTERELAEIEGRAAAAWTVEDAWARAQWLSELRAVLDTLDRGQRGESTLHLAIRLLREYWAAIMALAQVAAEPGSQCNACYPRPPRADASRIDWVEWALAHGRAFVAAGGVMPGLEDPDGT